MRIIPFRSPTQYFFRLMSSSSPWAYERVRAPSRTHQSVKAGEPKPELICRGHADIIAFAHIKLGLGRVGGNSVVCERACVAQSHFAG